LTDRREAIATDEIDILAGYSRDSADLIPRFEALRTPDVLAPAMALLPDRPSRILDVGAGTGRDSAWFARRGHAVVAVEPVPELRHAGMDLHRHANLAWLDDSLPRLAALAGKRSQFDLVLAVGVWQHLRPARQPEALATLAALLAPAGRLILSVRHGPGAPARPCFPADVDAMIAWGQAAGLELRLRREAESVQQRNRDAGVSWTWLCLERGTVRDGQDRRSSPGRHQS
jgi:SAM-dependent methyltransferase